DHLGVSNKTPNELTKNSHNTDTDADTDKKPDEIFNGADDDASGTSAIINIAHYYANKANNARTLVFSAFTAEEIGGYGSRYFSEQMDPNTITAMINIEMVGKPSKFGAGTIWMTGMERSNLGALLNESLKDKNIKIYQKL
ncbi:MAG: peptidase M23, partial [Alphaproteobacteria bacterium]